MQYFKSILAKESNKHTLQAFLIGLIIMLIMTLGIYVMDKYDNLQGKEAKREMSY